MLFEDLGKRFNYGLELRILFGFGRSYQCFVWHSEYGFVRLDISVCSDTSQLTVGAEVCNRVDSIKLDPSLMAPVDKAFFSLSCLQLLRSHCCVVLHDSL